MYVTDADEPVGLQLPNQWLWDIIDEFIYQVYYNYYSCFYTNLGVIEENEIFHEIFRKILHCKGRDKLLNS